MPKYRFRAPGHFMGTYYNEGDEVELFEKQAKYALMSGQLEATEEVHSYAQRYGSKGRVYGKPAEAKESKLAPTPFPKAPQEAVFGREIFRQTPKEMDIPHSARKRVSPRDNERVTRRGVGGTAGGKVKE